MINVYDLVYDLDLKLNKVATNRHQSIPREDQIVVLNQAQIKLIKQKVDTNNIYKSGIDSFNKRFDDLKDLIPPDQELSILQSGKNVWTSILPNDYMFYIGGYLIANKGNCTDRVINISGLIPHADISEWLINTSLCPSFEYQETFGTLSSTGLEIYTDEVFIPISLYLRYLRYPKQIDIEGYIHIDGTNSTDSDCELPSYLRDELVDIAVQELAAMTENLNAYEASNNRITTNE